MSRKPGTLEHVRSFLVDDLGAPYPHTDDASLKKYSTELELAMLHIETAVRDWLKSQCNPFTQTTDTGVSICYPYSHNIVVMKVDGILAGVPDEVKESARQALLFNSCYVIGILCHRVNVFLGHMDPSCPISGPIASDFDHVDEPLTRFFSKKGPSRQMDEAMDDQTAEGTEHRTEQIKEPEPIDMHLLSELRLSLQGSEPCSVSKASEVPGMLRFFFGVAARVRWSLMTRVVCWICYKCGTRLWYRVARSIPHQRCPLCKLDMEIFVRSSKFRMMCKFKIIDQNNSRSFDACIYCPSPESSPAGRTPVHQSRFALNFLPGEEYLFTGVQLATYRRNGNQIGNEPIFFVHDWEKTKCNIHAEIPPHVQNLSPQDLLTDLVASFAPSVCGMELLKKALILMLAADTTNFLHLVVYSLKEGSDLSPIWQYVDSCGFGKNVLAPVCTRAGLVASAMHGTVTPGLLVTQKMLVLREPEGTHFEMLHQAVGLSDLSVSIHKAGVMINLSTEVRLVIETPRRVPPTIRSRTLEMGEQSRPLSDAISHHINIKRKWQREVPFSQAELVSLIERSRRFQIDKKVAPECSEKFSRYFEQLRKDHPERTPRELGKIVGVVKALQRLCCAAEPTVEIVDIALRIYDELIASIPFFDGSDDASDEFYECIVNVAIRSFKDEGETEVTRDQLARAIRERFDDVDLAQCLKHVKFNQAGILYL